MFSFCFSVLKKVLIAIKNIFLEKTDTLAYFQCSSCLSFFKESYKRRTFIERLLNISSPYGVCELNLCRNCGIGTVHRVSIS